MAEITKALALSSLPESPAVSAALEHLSAIEKQLKNAEMEYGEEAMQHLTETVGAIKQLEYVRRATRELLEEESIENSKLRFKILHLPGNITKEIADAVSWARDSNASQLDELQSELRDLMPEIECTNQKQLSLEELNSSLCDRVKKMSERHEEVVQQLNVHMANKADKNIDLNETYSKSRDAKQAVIDLAYCLRDLEEDLVLEKEQHSKEIERLNKEIAELQMEIEIKKKRNTEKEECHAMIVEKLSEKEEHVSNVKELLCKTKHQILQLKNSSTLLTKQLDQQKMTTVELTNKKSYLETQLTSMEEECIKQREILKNKLLKVEENMQKATYLNKKLTSKSTDLNEEFLAVREEEDTEIEKNQETTLQLHKSASTLQEKLDHLANIRIEIKDMEKEIEKIQESSQLATNIYGAQLEESRSSLNLERQKRMTLQVKHDAITKQAELWKHAEDKYVNDITQRMEAGKKRSADLNEEGMSLQKDIMHKDSEIKRLTKEQIEAENKNKTIKEFYLEDIEKLESESKILKENLEKGGEELKMKIPILQEAQNKHDKHTRKYEDIKQQVGALKNKKKGLEDTIKGKKTGLEVLSKVKEKHRCTLKQNREAVVQQLKSQKEEVKLVEKDIYETNRKLELVTMENCRLKLNNEQKIHEIRKAIHQAEKQRDAAVDMDNHLILLYDLLMKGWARDTSTRKDFSERDQETLEAIKELVKKIQKREGKLRNLTQQLHDKYTGIKSLLQLDSGVRPEQKKEVHSTG
ncbi:coiled-coil domain-containing protein 175 isoform X1 [Pleurodeles waltl]|uniref:coiled-coil domain-containing protein 175 isoform X1 n=1 Tax=Pleurodeles waltl TaxID=8319 RepID=UPI0037096ABB